MYLGRGLFMYALFLILNQKDKLDTILEILYELGVGATTLDSVGMGKLLLDHNVNETIFASLRSVLNEGKPYNKTLISVIRDEETLNNAMQRIEDLLDIKNTVGAGFLFVVPVLTCSGRLSEDYKSC